jgi:hypothetical protein
MKLLIGAGAGVLQAALIQLIFGDDVQFERSCLSLTDIKTNDLDEYRKHLEKLYVKEPSKVDAIIGLAATYKTEDGQWDAEAYKKDLESYAGKGTNMNCKEFRSVKLWKIKDAHNPSDKEPVKTPTETTEDVGSYATREVCTDVIEDVPTIDGRSTTWSQIAAQYDCLRTTAFKDIVPNQTPLNKAIRALKIAQAITNGDYSYENISRLVEMSYKNPSGMKNVEGLDYNVYSNTLKATVLGKDVKVPNTLADCQRNTNVSLKVTNPVKKATKTVTQNGSAKDRIKTGENCSYDARMGGETSSYATRTERDNAVNEYKKTHQKAKQETW